MPRTYRRHGEKTIGGHPLYRPVLPSRSGPQSPQATEALAILAGLLRTATTPAERADLRAVMCLVARDDTKG